MMCDFYHLRVPLYFMVRYSKVLLVLLASLSGTLSAAPIIVKATLTEDIVLERSYETFDVQLKLVDVAQDKLELIGSILHGVAGLDTIQGRILIDIQSIFIDGLTKSAVGYIEGGDKLKGLANCALWKERMFDQTRLCYSASLDRGSQLKVVLDIEELPTKTTIERIETSVDEDLNTEGLDAGNAGRGIAVTENTGRENASAGN